MDVKRPAQNQGKADVILKKICQYGIQPIVFHTFAVLDFSKTNQYQQVQSSWHVASLGSKAEGSMFYVHLSIYYGQLGRSSRCS